MNSGRVIDSFAVLAYLQGEKGARKVQELLRQAAPPSPSPQLPIFLPEV